MFLPDASGCLTPILDLLSHWESHRLALYPSIWPLGGQDAWCGALVVEVFESVRPAQGSKSTKKREGFGVEKPPFPTTPETGDLSLDGRNRAIQIENR